MRTTAEIFNLELISLAFLIYFSIFLYAEELTKQSNSFYGKYPKYSYEITLTERGAEVHHRRS
jgi:hypothetical protein